LEKRIPLLWHRKDLLCSLFVKERKKIAGPYRLVIRLHILHHLGEGKSISILRRKGPKRNENTSIARIPAPAQEGKATGNAISFKRGKKRKKRKEKKKPPAESPSPWSQEPPFIRKKARHSSAHEKTGSGEKKGVPLLADPSVIERGSLSVRRKVWNRKGQGNRSHPARREELNAPMSPIRRKALRGMSAI